MDTNSATHVADLFLFCYERDFTLSLSDNNQAEFELIEQTFNRGYRQILGIPMDTNSAPLVADLFLFCYERDFMLSLSDNNQADLLKHLTLAQDIQMPCIILKSLILNKW